jgi:hypothetical protein
MFISWLSLIEYSYMQTMCLSYEARTRYGHGYVNTDNNLNIVIINVVSVSDTDTCPISEHA